MQEENLKPRVGIGVMIFKDGKILLGKRKGSHGAGDYAFPCGHLEYGEAFEDCIKREVEEECGIKIKNLKFQYLANIDYYMPKHYVQIGMTADWESGEAKVKEPEKCESWNWYEINNLPEPLFEGFKFSLDSYKTRKNYYDLGDDYLDKK